MKITTLSPSVRADGPMVQPPFVTIPEESTQNNTLFNDDAEDNIGSLYYVVTVIFIYGFSIVLMIASHIRKNQQDNQLRTYLKEMALLRKKDRREKIMGRMTTINATNAVCNNLHNVASGTGALTTTIGSGTGLGNGSISRGQQPISSGCTYAHMNIGNCPYGIHVAGVNVTQNQSIINAQNVSHGNYPKNNQPPFLNDCVVNCSNPPLVPAAQASNISGLGVPQPGSNPSMLPVASFTPTTTSNNSNNMCPTSSSSSKSSSVSTTAITLIASTSVTYSTTSETISTTAVASTSTCDSAISTGSSVYFAESLLQQQQPQQHRHYMNHHHKVDEAQEIMLLQAQLTQIQLHQKQEQHCLSPILPLESHCVKETANRVKSPIETNIEIISENVIT